MTQNLTVLAGTAASLGFLHTILGPDHYLPFIVISKARNWSMTKTFWITLLCGLGHIISSVIIGGAGIIVGIAIRNIETFESFRGDIAGWLFMIFGLVYFLWGLRRAIVNKAHSHRHYHNKGSQHAHEHIHHGSHDHLHNNEKAINLTPWILFLIFVFGPCEVLVPILMYPAAEAGIGDMLIITCLFALTTIGTMLTVVMLASYGLKMTRLGKLEKYTHAIAGAAILFSGIAISFLGL